MKGNREFKSDNFETGCVENFDLFLRWKKTG